MDRDTDNGQASWAAEWQATERLTFLIFAKSWDKDWSDLAWSVIMKYMEMKLRSVRGHLKVFTIAIGSDTKFFFQNAAAEASMLSRDIICKLPRSDIS